jgi:hypothetical protein
MTANPAERSGDFRERGVGRAVGRQESRESLPGRLAKVGSHYLEDYPVELLEDYLAVLSVNRPVESPVGPLLRPNLENLAWYLANRLVC